MALPTIRIFISSPSDVRPERLRAEQIIARLDREFAYHFRVEALLWEREPLVADRHFQAEGNIPSPRGTDIVVVILWTRLGVPLPENQFRGALSGRPVTGTEWEFEDALAGARGSGRPDLLLYRKDVPLTADLGDRRLLEERLAQLDLVESFVGRWFRSEDGGSFTAASHSFTTSTEFEEKLYDHLRALLGRHAGAAADGGEIRWHGPPFRGLAPFEAEHAAVFFGRTEARNALRERLARADAHDRGFLLVLGASGSGKSSLVRAGLLPDLVLPGMVGRVSLVRQAAMRPSDRPGDLCGALAAALLSPAALPELLALRYAPERLADLLRGAPGQVALPVEQGLHEASRVARLPERAEARVVVLLDQLEEMFSPNGSNIVTASGDDTAVLWQATTGMQLAVLMGHTGVVSRAAFTPDGGRIVTAGGDGTARIWTAAVDPVAVLAGGTRPAVEGAAWSPDGRRAAAGTQDGAVFILDGETGAVLHRLAGHTDGVGHVAWSPDGRALASASLDGTARIWDADTGAEIALLQGHAKPIRAIMFSPDGRQVLTGSGDGTARLWDGATGRAGAVLSGHGGAVLSARFSPDGRQIATASADGTARIWDAATGGTVAVLAGHGGPVNDAAFRPDGARVATASDDGTARVWSSATGAQLLSVGRPGADGVLRAAWSPTGDRLLTAFRQSRSQLWDASSGAPLRGFYGDAPVFSPDGLRIATVLTPMLDRTVTTGDRKVILFDAATGATLADYLGHTSSLIGVAFSPDGSHLLSTAWDGTARFWPVWPLLTGDTVAYAKLAALRRLTPQERSSLDLDPERAVDPADPPLSDPAAACDALAGNAFDPARRAPGVAFADIDADRAVPACRRAAEAAPGEPRLLYEFGRALQRAGQFPAARDAMARAATAGSAAGAYGLGVMLQAGLGGATDLREALRLYRRADEAGMPDADFKIAQVYLAGAGVARDPAEALRWLERGAARGGPYCRNALGLLQETGDGVPRDLEAALRDYVLADRTVEAARLTDDLDVTPRRGAVARALAPGTAVRVAREASAAP